ncbi:MAG: thioesterase family protein [Deinococcales bacterium]|nr:thioesterase family protein [Deinococcales bacterium]
MAADAPTEPNAYFVRESATRFRPTAHVSGAWATDEQHIAPAIGLLAHALERDHAARRGGELRLSRLSCDILGVIPLEPVELEVRLLRPGRTIELLEATLSHAGRAAVMARAWFTARFDTADLAGAPFPPLTPRHAMQRWHVEDLWRGGFVRTAQVWRRELAQGHVHFWVRSDVSLLDGEAVGRVPHALRLVDVANGVAARVDPEAVAFPNLDLTVSLFREPEGEHTGCASVASFGPDGAGLTQNVLYDERGAFGAFSQSLTVRPR